MTDLIGLVMPFFIDYINRNIANSSVRFVISLVSCLIVAALLNLQKLTGGDVSGVLASAGIIFTEAQAVYKLYWDKSQLRRELNLK